MSNEIIRRCCREINLDKIFEGHVMSGKKSLADCIKCCEQWKEIYDKVFDNRGQRSLSATRPHAQSAMNQLQVIVLKLLSATECARF